MECEVAINVVSKIENNGNKCKKNNCIKLKDEIGMAVPKSTQTRMVGIIT